MKEAQQTMMEHSEVKVKLLKLYLERYLKVIGLAKGFTDIYIYDLFCGEGIYSNGGKGSPLIILDEINDTYKKLKEMGKIKGKFNCHFNDIEQWKIDKVKNEIQNKNLHNPEIGNLVFTTCDYRELLLKISKQIAAFKNEKAFIFIDPYGYKDIRISDIKELLDTNKAEVLLFLPTQFMFRFEKKATPESLKQFINELMPISSWPNSETGIDFIEKLKESFRNALDGHFVDSFIISRDINQFFCLFFFTSHIYGFDRMLDAKWQIDEEEGRGWDYRVTNSLFAPLPKVPSTGKFEKQLIAFLKEGRKDNSELYKFTLDKGHLPQHTNDVLGRLQDEGKLIVAKDDQKVRKGAFYINYEGYKSTSKVNFKIK